MVEENNRNVVAMEMWLWRKKTIKNVVVVVEEENDRNVVVAVVEEMGYHYSQAG